MTSDPKSSAEDRRWRLLDKIAAERFSRSFLLIVLMLLLALFIYMVRMFITPVLLAAVFTGLFFPLYKSLCKVVKGKRNLASLIMCFGMLAGLLLPLYFIGGMVSREAIQLYETSEETIQNIITQGQEGPLKWLEELPIPEYIRLEEIDWQSGLTEVAQVAGSVIARVVRKTYESTFQLVVNLAIILFTMFYFFRDGEKLVERLKFLSPLSELHEVELINRFRSVSRAAVRGTLFLGLIQGTVGAITLVIFGVSSPVLWGVVMVVLSIIPMVGPWAVLFPAAIIQMIMGNIWQGIVMILITAIVIGNIDNLFRPRLVGKDAGMHDLMILFSTLGGISLFGVMGFIVGPVVAAMMLTALDIYGLEFKNQLDYAQTLGSRQLTETEETEEDKEIE